MYLLVALAIAIFSGPHAAAASQPTLPAIPNQTLDKALKQFARASQLQLAYVADISKGLLSPGCPAGLTAAEALSRLLEGTGLEFEFINERTVRILSASDASTLKKTTLQTYPPPLAASVASVALPEISKREPDEFTLNEITVVGSRSLIARTNTESLVPVDVVSSAELSRMGQTDLNQMLNFVVPSFNSARQTIADGTDHIDPATLRGLGPDQVLVLVNGKRQHTTALVNVNSTVGRGSVGYDMNSVPPQAIERIEVLRDGAAAQYGSDAISGVINIVLKSGADTGRLATHFSQTEEGDGRTVVGSFSDGIALGNAGGFLNGTLQYSDRGATDRSGTYNNTVYLPLLSDSRYFGTFTADEYSRKLADDALVAERGFDRSAMVVGNASSKDYRGFFNSALPISGTLQVYGFGGYDRRNGRAAGFYRYPNAVMTRNLTLYPDGYLPFIETDIDDVTLALGAKRTSDQGWNVDLSNEHGFNSIEFEVDNSLNPSLGAQSPRHFYSGALSFDQNTTNLDFSRRLDRLGGLRSFNMAFGAEYRVDRYRISPGEQASWGDYNPPDAWPSQAVAVGAQVFSGFRPDNRADETRSNFSLYADFESDVSDRLLLGAAARLENYSDFGSNLSGKLAGRFDIVDGLAIRGGINKGFRAPSLHQKFYSATSTQFITVNGLNQQREVSTVRNDAAITRSLGIPELGPETSLSYSLGLAVSFGSNLQFTLDTYQIDIDDRIVLSGRFSNSIPQLAEFFQGTDITDAQFFTNAIDTRTRGTDAIVTYRRQFDNARTLSLNAAFNYNKTRITGLRTPSQLAGLGETLLNREERGRIEVNQPRDKLILTLGYAIEHADFFIQTTRFGEITTVAPQDPVQDQTFGAKFVTDLAFAYKVTNDLSFTFGANNIFDVYPDRVADPRLTNNGTVPYSRFATQFGFNGATYFAKWDFVF